MNVWMYRLLRLNKQPTLTPYRVYNLISEYTIDISKARSIFGYDPPDDFQTRIRLVKHWLEEENGRDSVR